MGQRDGAGSRGVTAAALNGAAGLDGQRLRLPGHGLLFGAALG